MSSWITYSHLQRLVDCVRKMDRGSLRLDMTDGSAFVLSYDHDSKYWNVQACSIHGDEHVDTMRRIGSFLRKLDAIRSASIIERPQHGVALLL